jgi:hypothetical protein
MKDFSKSSQLGYRARREVKIPCGSFVFKGVRKESTNHIFIMNDKETGG